MKLAGRALGEASGRTYDVFISHAGPQKANFAVWLQRELRRHGIGAFLDETSLRYCDAADAEMEATLRSCSLVIFVLTPDFVRSSYCLDELHWALHPSQPQQQNAAGPGAALQSAASSPAQPEAALQQSTQRSSNQPLLLPVFYHTSDIDALQQDVERQLAEARMNGASAAALQRLQHAGADLGDLCGFTGDRLDSHSKLDSFHVDAIVAEVLRRLNRPTFEAPTHAVDLKTRIQELLLLLQPDQAGGRCVLSLHGMGGIGKTTMAKDLFNQLGGSSLQFSSRIFMEVGQDAPLEAKQRQLLDLLGGSSMPAAGSIAQLQQQLKRCIQQAGPLLLVLDDIWTPAQRDMLLSLDALPAGSRVILTGRNGSDLHPDSDICVLRPVEELGPEEAEVLLCQHAFAVDWAPPGYSTAVAQALAVCGGLPLALQVAGADMCNRSPAAAENSSRQLLAEAGPSTGRCDASGNSLSIVTLLQRSFNQLPSDNHRHLFLDAALIMRNRPQEHLLALWAGILQQQEDNGQQQPFSLAHWQQKAETLWSACAQATLVCCRTFSPEDWKGNNRASPYHIFSRVHVHDCMVELARAASRHLTRSENWSLTSLSPTTRLPRAPTGQAKASRLYCGPPGVSTMPPWSICELLSRHQQCQLAAMDLDQFPAAAAAASSDGSTPPELLYLRLTTAPQHCAFGAQLLVLDASGDGVGVRVLWNSIAACSGLRHLRLRDQQLCSLPDSICSLSSLEVLVLRGCRSLAQLPNSITCLQCLQTLDLAECSTLQQLPDCMGNLHDLEVLHVGRCYALRQLPGSIGSLVSLQVLDINWCTALQQLPDSIGSLSSLTTLDASSCYALQQLPDSIVSLADLETLDLTWCRALQRLPDSIGSLASLMTLDVSSCEALQQLPDSIGSLASLTMLDVSYCTALQQLPDSIGSLPDLNVLDISGCQTLQQLPSSIGSLTRLRGLDMGGCEALQQLPDSIGGLSDLEILEVGCCQTLQQLPDSIGTLASLQFLAIGDCGVLQRLPDSIGSLSALTVLVISSCQALQQLPESIGDLASLCKLVIEACSALQQLPESISRLASLGTLDVSHCDALQRLPQSIGSSPGLTGICLANCSALQWLPDSIGGLTSLKELSIGGLGVLQQLPGSIGSLCSLELLCISDCAMLQQLPDSISSLACLERLIMMDCKAVRQLPDGIGNLARLETLVIRCCKALQQLPDSIGSLSRLTGLDLSCCKALQRLPDSIGSLASLKAMRVGRSKALQQLPDSIGNLSNLKTLDLSSCPILQRLPYSIGNLSSLRWLDLSCCPRLQQLPDTIDRIANLSIDGW